MIINDNTKNNLKIEYLYSKIKVYSPYGIELKKQLQPFKFDETDQLRDEYHRIGIIIDEIIKDRYSFVELRNNFKKVKGLKTTFKKIRNDDLLTVTEFFELKNFLFILKDISKILNKIELDIGKDYEIDRIQNLEELLDPEGYGVNSFYIYDEYSKKLKQIRKKISDFSRQKKVIKKNLIEKYSLKFDLNIRRSGEIIVDKDNKQLIRKLKDSDDFYYKSETFMNISFAISNNQEINALESKIEDLKAIEEKETNKIRKQLTKSMFDYIAVLEGNYRNIGNLDLLIGKAFFSHGIDGVKPILSDNNVIMIEEGRHLIVEEELRKNNKKYIPVSVRLSQGVSLLTGANMGGKTVSLKMVGLLTYMAQLGLFIPATKFKYKPVKYIFASLGDDQDINRGLSSFGAEIENVKKAIDHCEQYGLILIDELARGTNPKEGFALSKALIKYFKNKESIIFISTHFDGLVAKGINHLQVKGLKEISEDISFENIQEHMDYRLIEVKNKTQVPKDALNISRILGLKLEIIDSAEKILQEGSERSGE